MPDRPQFLMASGPRGLTAYAFDGRGFVAKGAFELPPVMVESVSEGECSYSTDLTCGDVDDDGADELVTCASTELRKYEWQDSGFVLTGISGVSPTGRTSDWWVGDAAIGDVNNDDTAELLLVGIPHVPNNDYGAPRDSTYLFVCRWLKGNIEVLWNDEGRLDFECFSAVMPSNEMVGVMDMCNEGRNELVVAEGQSDVSATVFDRYRWQRDGLVLRDMLIIVDSHIQREPISAHGWGAVMGMPEPVTVGGRTSLFVPSPEGGGLDWRGKVLCFAGDSLVSEQTIWADNKRYSSRTIVDLDGNGPGVLRLIPDPDGPAKFEFYRL